MSAKQAVLNTYVRSCLAAGLLAFGSGLAGAYPAHQVFGVTPDEGSVGTRVRIAATGFERRPKVFLKSAFAAKEGGISLRVRSVTDNDVQADVRRPAPPGDYQVFVRPRGARQPMLVPGTFQMRGPQIDRVTETDNKGKRELTIEGSNLGSRRGKVFAGNLRPPGLQIDPPSLDIDAGPSDSPPSLEIETGPAGKRASRRPPGDMFKAKILEWTDSKVRVRLRKKTPEGDVDVFLDNRVGNATGRSTNDSEVDSVVDELQGIVILAKQP